MKIKYYLFIVVMIFSLNAYSQDENKNTKYYKHEFGVQFNPLFIKKSYFRYQPYISSMIYVYHINEYLAFGPIISNAHVKPTTNYSSNTYNFGGISKFTYTNRTRFIPFAEVYTGAQISKSSYTFHGIFNDTTMNSRGFNYYVAPGVKFMFRNTRFSFDLMYKFSTIKLYNNKNAVFSWRFCYSFGRTNKQTNIQF